MATYGDLGTCVTRGSIQSDTVSTGRSVDLDFARVGLESLRGIFSGDSALDGKATSVDMVLSQTELLERNASGDLDLRSNNVDTGNLLGDRVLDLDTRVDFDKVVSALLVDQELGGTGVSVSDSMGELEGIVQDSLSDRLVKVRRGSHFDNLNTV